MRRRPRMLVLTSVLGLATASLTAVAPVQALAGTGVSQYCEDDGNDIPILTTPITLGVESGALVSQTLPNYVELCYATSSWGNAAPETEGGAITVYVALPGTAPLGTYCASDVNAGQLATLSCSTAVNPSAAFSPGAGGGGTLTVAVPITFCLGTNLTGQLACGGSTPTLGGTGVVVGTFSVTGPPPGYTTGGGVTLTGLNVVVDGVSLPLSGGTTQAGVNPAVAGANTGGGLPFCAPVLGCATLPLAAWAGTQPISSAEIVVAGVPLAVPAVARECLSFGMTCPLPY